MGAESESEAGADVGHPESHALVERSGHRDGNLATTTDTAVEGGRTRIGSSAVPSIAKRPVAFRGRADVPPIRSSDHLDLSASSRSTVFSQRSKSQPASLGCEYHRVASTRA